MARSVPKQEDPIAQFNKWFDQARRAKAPLPEAMAVATAGRDGRVSVRFILLKQADDQGFVFYTDRRSPKGRDLSENPRAALAFYWDAIGKQVRVAGQVEEASAAEADAYWATRPRQSRLAGSVSKQSQPLASRAELLAAVERFRGTIKGPNIPRPSYWIGFRLIPDEIEFWTRRNYRLHERELFERTSNGWKRTLLQP